MLSLLKEHGSKAKAWKLEEDNKTITNFTYKIFCLINCDQTLYNKEQKKLLENQFFHIYNFNV